MVTIVNEVYEYHGQVYELIYEVNASTEEWVCQTPELEEQLRKIYYSPMDLYFLTFTDEMNKTYIFDSEEEMSAYNQIEAPKRSKKYFDEYQQADNTLRNNCWLTFAKDCGNEQITICAPDHIDNYDAKNLGPPSYGICSVLWEQSDLGNVPMPQVPGGNWDQSISRFSCNGVDSPFQPINGATLTVRFFRGIDFDGEHRCRHRDWSITNPFVSTCLTNERWGFLCDDMNDSISSWRAVWCGPVGCEDDDCFDLFGS